MATLESSATENFKSGSAVAGLQLMYCRDSINAKIMHFYAKCFPKTVVLNLQCFPGTQI